MLKVLLARSSMYLTEQLLAVVQVLGLWYIHEPMDS
jgi:hypothetical protein